MQILHPSSENVRKKIQLINGIPLYIQIAEELSAQIEARILVPGEKLLAERELSRMWGVSRMTLRQALHVLEVQGLLIRRRGVGTYVATPKIERNSNRLIPFTQGMQQKGYATSARLIALTTKKADISIARRLNVSVGTMVYYGHRLRFLNQEPVMLEKFVLLAEPFPQLETKDLETQSLYHVLKVEYGVMFRCAKQSFEAVVATAYESDLLNVPLLTPLMLEERISFDQYKRTLEYAKDLYRGDRFRFVTEVSSSTS